ncbi:MAG: D-arabinono-1,4-lactone oxidase [Thermomicrobiales bacterium]
MLTRIFFRQVLPRTILTNVRIVDHSNEALTMEHELFKHLEIEIFVPARHLRASAEYVRAIFEVFDGASPAPSADIAASLDAIGMLEELKQHVGKFTYHYSISFRRILPDDTLISMTADTDEPFYSISLITYVEPRDRFYEVASFLARSMAKLFDARLHWGKYFPLSNADIEGTYPHLPEFRTICERTDPNGVFRNDFVNRVVFNQV